MNNGKNTPQQIPEFSVDYDMSMVIKYVFRIFGMLLFGLFALEVASIITNLVFENELPDQPRYLTKEIIHTIFGFVGGWGGNIVTNFFAKVIAERLQKSNDTSSNQTDSINWNK